jgi:DNA-directed RNA polymerase subunit RPC12/RpoP
MRGDNYNIDTKHFIVYQLKWIRSCVGNGVKDFFGWLFSSSPFEKEEFYSSLRCCCMIRDIENKGIACPDCGSKIKRIG